jgi:PAS domain S-box-containing protein
MTENPGVGGEARAARPDRPHEDVGYRELVERLPLVTYVDEPTVQARSLYISPQVEDLLGYAPREWLDDPDLFGRLLHPDDRERVLEDHAGAFAERASRWAFEYRVVARDGRVVWLRDEAVLASDDDGRPLYVQGFLTDITERRPRLAIELCDDRAGGGASFAIMAGGGRMPGDVQLGYPERERRVRAAAGEIEDFGSLRRASFEPSSGEAAAEGCAELKVWAHRITLDGESEGLAGRVLVEPDDGGERLELPLLRGQILLPLAGVPRRLDIVPDETS